MRLDMVCDPVKLRKNKIGTSCRKQKTRAVFWPACQPEQIGEGMRTAWHLQVVLCGAFPQGPRSWVCWSRDPPKVLHCHHHNPQLRTTILQQPVQPLKPLATTDQGRAVIMTASCKLKGRGGPREGSEKGHVHHVPRKTEQADVHLRVSNF